MENGTTKSAANAIKLKKIAEVSRNDTENTDAEIDEDEDLLGLQACMKSKALRALASRIADILSGL